jgi:ribosomal protein L29
MDLKTQILVALGLDKEETISLEWQAKSEDGTIFVSTAEELEAGVDISVLTEDGTTILLPIGTYKTDTGVTFRVEDEGIVAEVMESETEEVVEEEELAEEEEDKKDYADVADWEGMEKRIQNLEDAVASLKEEKVGGDDEVEELAEEVEERGTTPKSIKTTEVVEFSVEELKAENDKLKAELAAQPASAPLDTNKFSSDRKPMARKEYNKLSKREKFLHDLNK